MHDWFKTIFANFLSEAKKRNIESIVMVSPIVELGYPSNIISKSLLRDVYNERENLTVKNLTIIVNDEEDQ